MLDQGVHLNPLNYTWRCPCNYKIYAETSSEMSEQFGNTETVVGFGKNGQKRGCEWIFLYIMDFP